MFNFIFHIKYLNAVYTCQKKYEIYGAEKFEIS